VKVIESPADWSELVEIVGATRDDDPWLTPAEREFRDRLPLAKRRDEWTAARVAARRLALRRGFVSAPLELEIRIEDRVPRARAGDREFFLSFSHTGGFAAAALLERPVGIDLELLRSLDPRIARFFLSDAESAAASSASIENPLLHFWAAKEAAFKFVEHAPLLSAISMREIESFASTLRAGFSFGEQRGVVETRLLANFAVLAVARED
jgi:phosphopantetheinyl transferase